MQAVVEPPLRAVESVHAADQLAHSRIEVEPRAVWIIELHAQDGQRGEAVA